MSLSEMKEWEFEEIYKAIELMKRQQKSEAEKVEEARAKAES